MPAQRWIYERFTSCSGCQLALLNCERELSVLAEGVHWVSFPMASSVRDDGCAVDVVLAEGSLLTPEEISRLMALRSRAVILVAPASVLSDFAGSA